MAGKVSKCIALDSADLIALLHDGNTLKKYQFDLAQLPAMFIPNTYKMYYDTDENQFTERMANEFRLFWTPLRKEKNEVHWIKISQPSNDHGQYRICGTIRKFR